MYDLQSDVGRHRQEHKDELALGVGAAAVLGLGIAVDIPEAEVTHLGYFVLSCLIGHPFDESMLVRRSGAPFWNKQLLGTKGIATVAKGITSNKDATSS